MAEGLSGCQQGETQTMTTTTTVILTDSEILDQLNSIRTAMLRAEAHARVDVEKMYSIDTAALALADEASRLHKPIVATAQVKTAIFTALTKAGYEIPDWLK
jgi:ABC-type transporter Mla MlaB component